MSNIKTRKFCGVDIDINDFYESFPYNKKGFQNHQFFTAFNTENVTAEFLKFDWYYIGKSKFPTLDSHPFNNKEIKAKGSEQDDVDNIAFDFRTNGYDTSKFPGIVDESGIFQNGRIRNKAARQNGEDWVPVAVFNIKTKDKGASKISFGSIANSGLFHKTQHKNTMNDYIEQGVAVVERDIITNDENEVRDWITTETRIETDFSDEKVTQVINQIVGRTSEEFALVNQDIDKEDFVNNYKIASIKHQGKISLYKAKGRTAGMKYFVNNCLNTGGNPPPTILYTDGLSPEECGSDLYQFIRDLKKMHKGTFHYIDNSVEGLSVKPTIFDTSFILGIIPNLDRGSQQAMLKNGMTISIEQYIKDSGFKKPKATVNKTDSKKISKVLGAV